MERYIMTIDAGTTSLRSIIFNHRGESVAMAQKELKLYYPQPSWVEQDPMEILDKQIEVCNEALKNAGLQGKDILSIGITNQRETAVIWDRETGVPIYNAIVWQCRRTTKEAKDLLKNGIGDFIHSKTGLFPDAYFSATKIHWILDNVEDARYRAEQGELAFGTIDSWLIYNLTSKLHITDHSNACRTMLFNIEELTWDSELLELFNIPLDMLPEVRDSGGYFGHTKPEIFGCEIPINAVLGDQQAALFGQCCFNPGEAKNTYGTGAFILMNIGEELSLSDNGIISTIFYTYNNQVVYAMEGSIFVAGSAIQWLRDELGLIELSADSEDCARRVKDTAGCYVVPAFTGLGAPYWNGDTRGVIMGITRGVNRDHIVRATLESIAYLTNDVLGAFESDSNTKLKELKVDGGAAENDFLMGFQANITNTRILRPKSIEATALGVCYLSGLVSKLWTDEEEIRSLFQEDKIFEPEISTSERTELLGQWQKAIDFALKY